MPSYSCSSILRYLWAAECAVGCHSSIRCQSYRCRGVSVNHCEPALTLFKLPDSPAAFWKWCSVGVAAKWKKTPQSHQSQVNSIRQEMVMLCTVAVHDFLNSSGIHTPSWRAGGQAQVCLQLIWIDFSLKNEDLSFSAQPSVSGSSSVSPSQSIFFTAFVLKGPPEAVKRGQSLLKLPMWW